MKKLFSILWVTLCIGVLFLVPVQAQETTECEEGFRLFESEYIVSESICVPETAERIVTLDPFYSLQMSVEMDLPVIGAASYSGERNFPAALSEEDLEGIEVVGAFEAPNLETITTIAPDLIIGDGYFHAANHELFSEIAPTILISGAGWKGWYTTIAEAAGVPERAETAFDEYNARITDLQALLPDGVTVSFLRVVPDGFQLYREAPNAYAPVAVMTEAGVVRPEFESGTDEESFARLDFEGLASIEGDILLYTISGEADSITQLEADTVSNPIWQLLPSVEAEQAFLVDAGHWMSFGSLSSAHAVLDDLFTFVAGVDPQEVSPNPFSMDMTEATEETPAATFPLTIEHEVGSTTIESVPERIVVLEYSFADHLGTLGIAPVGFAVDAPPEYIYAYTSDVGAVEVGTRAEPNLEAIVELNPDFIIGDLRRHEAIYDDLSLIAPTVIFNSLRGSYDDQLEQFSIIAEVVGKSDEAAEILASYQETFETALASTNADAGEFVVGVLWSGGFTAHSDESFMGSFLESLGRNNALEPLEGETQYLLDMEGFASVNPSTIVILCNPEDQQYLDEMTDSDLWQAFDAVINNRVYAFDRNLWSKGRGVTAYEMILADSVNSGLLADTESQTSVCGGISAEQG